jgi:hypothetical protein
MCCFACHNKGKGNNKCAGRKKVFHKDGLVSTAKKEKHPLKICSEIFY